jgi:hypothetical protein
MYRHTPTHFFYLEAALAFPCKYGRDFGILVACVRLCEFEPLLRNGPFPESNFPIISRGEQAVTYSPVSIKVHQSPDGL